MKHHIHPEEEFEYESECICFGECLSIVNARCKRKTMKTIEQRMIKTQSFVFDDFYAKDRPIMIIACEDLFYPQYKGRFFILERSAGYGYFSSSTFDRTYSAGELMDKFGIIITQKP